VAVGVLYLGVREEARAGAAVEHRPGLELVTALQGRIGLDLARSQLPALILLDLNLGDVEGQEFSRELERDPLTAPIPVIVVSADAALDAFAVSEPDLVLLDLHMPGRDGYQVLAEIRSRAPAIHGLPVVVLTADVTSDAKLTALDRGASDFLTKPFDPAEVLLRMRNLLTTRALHLEVQCNIDLLELRVRERTAELEAAQFEVAQRLARAAVQAGLAPRARTGHDFRGGRQGLRSVAGGGLSGTRRRTHPGRTRAALTVTGAGTSLKHRRRSGGAHPGAPRGFVVAEVEDVVAVPQCALDVGDEDHLAVAASQRAEHVQGLLPALVVE